MERGWQTQEQADDRRGVVPLQAMRVPSTILIVMEVPNTVELVRLYLRRDGHKVLAAADGPAVKVSMRGGSRFVFDLPRARPANLETKVR